MSATLPTPSPHGSITHTCGFVVRVTPAFDTRESSPTERRYLFRYAITIENNSTVTAMLHSRRWLIKDADSNEFTVQGEGVVGIQPVLRPGESFTYNSFCPLHTPWGTMEGAYSMVGDGGDAADEGAGVGGLKPTNGQGHEFEIAVGRFYLVYRDDENAQPQHGPRSAGAKP